MDRFIGIDIGAETVKVVELTREGVTLRLSRRGIVDHEKRPAAAIRQALESWDIARAQGALVTGRLSRQLRLERVPPKQAQLAGYRFLCGEAPATVVSIGGHGFSVLEIRDSGIPVFRENSRCSQGTGNFLRQLVERFDLTIEAAAALADGVDAPAALSGRCPVILKTDMTHLANLGEGRERILAGLFDAVCENVQVLVKPYVSPPAVVLTGGVSRASRVRRHFRRFCEKHDMVLLDIAAEDALYLEAAGCAALASERPCAIRPLEELTRPPTESALERLPALALSLGRVRRLTRAPLDPSGPPETALLGLDIGSTGSKAVLLSRAGKVLWEGYLRTNGDPVGAAQGLVRALREGPAQHHHVAGVGVTGSGREIVGSLLASCYGGEAVYILNEIAAHAEGALSFDSRVDTIFEIGGQDAKYIRLVDGRVVDSAMNEACSAGTGSFIEEQGKRFAGVRSVADLGQAALAADHGVALGQHCSVFMAEIVDEAVAAGVPEPAIMAGLFDSVIQNYLNRVKASRSVGSVIFCQGMPFSSDALAAAVARQTHASVIVPPSPGTTGALGIALLCRKALAAGVPLELGRFLEARVERKDTFVCQSNVGCGEAGNRCRIDRIGTVVAGARQRFTWGGGCSLYDKGTRKQKLPDRAPDPFREREALVQELAARLGESRQRPRVAMTDELQLKGLYPFFATFVHGLGFDIVTHRGADRAALKRGIAEANVPFCAPMQQYHGLFAQMLDSRPDYIFAPMIRELPKVKDEPISVTCPIVQAAPDMLALDLARPLADGRTALISPVVDIGPGTLDGQPLLASCRALAASLGVRDEAVWMPPYRAARAAQLRFDDALTQLGRRALAFCVEHDVLPIIVLGRAYTIYNQVLNSNVPAILREQGALAIPVDCYPVVSEVPTFTDMFWGHGQRILRAAHQVRRAPGIYGLFCSNYSCGPDSFTVHFLAYVMEGKPFAVIETDGHSGDAGTKTRIEAFLHCVREDRSARGPKSPSRRQRPNQLKLMELERVSPAELRGSSERVLIPRMGPGAEAIAAALTGFGIRSEALPVPDRDALNIGRRHTSGKECVPMTITLGSLLQRLQQERDTRERFAFFMPGSRGPCRFGAYQLLHKIVLERLGWGERVRVWSPPFDDYFEGLPGGFAAVCLSAIVAADLLLEAYNDVRPVEKRPGVARTLYGRYSVELNEVLHAAGAGDLSPARALAEVASGRLYGVTDLLARAGTDFAAVKEDRDLPEVAVVGEIYVRCDPFANDYILEKLAERGIRAHLAPVSEWLEYSDFVGWFENRKDGFGERISSVVQQRVQQVTYATVARRLGWEPRVTVEQALRGAADYARQKLECETVLTLGAPMHEWRAGRIDAVVSTGPLECMPNKIAESQFYHAAEREGLLSLTLAVNGDPLDPEVFDSFAYEVHARHRAKKRAAAPARETTPLWAAARLAVHAMRGPLEKLAGLSPFPLPFAGDVPKDDSR
jgi:predicted CoA-substrate-specific enzyme activase